MDNNKELRSITGTVEIRANQDGSPSRTIEGYAIVWNKDSRVLFDWGGAYIERISKDALEGVDMSDVVATFNHDFNYIQGRTSSNTLQLMSDDYGLKYQFDAPNTTAGNDLLENIRNGNVKGSSFMFTIAKQRWTFASKDDEMDVREVLQIGNLYELGPVVMPAYNDTTAAARSYEAERKQQEDNGRKQNRTALKIKFIKAKNQ